MDLQKRIEALDLVLADENADWGNELFRFYGSQPFAKSDFDDSAGRIVFGEVWLDIEIQDDSLWSELLVTYGAHHAQSARARLAARIGVKLSAIDELIDEDGKWFVETANEVIAALQARISDVENGRTLPDDKPEPNPPAE